jgi:hypothetical protein
MEGGAATLPAHPVDSPTIAPAQDGEQLAQSVPMRGRDTDVLEQYGLGSVLADLRSRKIRTTFSHYISDIPTDVVPVRPRCRAGSLMEIAMQPVNEDERRLEEFDERVLRAALTLREGGPRPALPAWLDEEQPIGDDDRRKRKERRKKKKKRRSSKRKRDSEAGDGSADGHEDALDDDERRLKKKRKKRKNSEAMPSPVGATVGLQGPK